LVGGLLFALLAQEVEAQEVRLERTRPPGFEDLLESRELNLNLFIDGQAMGPIPVELRPGSVRFLDPAQLLPLLPELRQADRILAALKLPLASNAALSCSPRPRKGCGRLDPEIVGVILSRDINRVDLFLARSALGPPRRNLPDPPAGPATVAGALDLQYGLSRHGLTYALRQRGIAGFGRAHLAVDSIVTNRFAELDRAYVRRVGNRLALTAGLFPASHYNFIFLDRFLGASVATTNESRIDRATLSDTPLLIDSSVSGQVEIHREGVLLETQQLAPGQTQIDTSRFPGGVYPVTLKITDGSGEWTETRLFARTPGLPALGETEFFAEAGANVPFRATSRGDFFPDILSPAVRAGVRHRLSPQIGTSGRVEASSKRRLVEIGGDFLQRNWRASATVGLADNGDHAAALAVSGSVARINWSLAARGVNGSQSVSGDPERGLGRSYRQVAAFGGWSSRRVSLHTGLLWRRDGSGPSSWFVLPQLRWTIAQRSGRIWQLDASGSAGRSEWMARLGIRATLFGGRTSTSIFAGGEARRRDGATRLEPLLRSDWQRSLDLGVDALALRAGVTHESDRTTGRLGGDLTTAHFQASANATIEEALSSSSLFGYASTQFGFADGRLAFGSGIYTGAGVIAEVPGAPDDARFAVRTGGMNSRTFPGQSPIFAATAPFTQYNVGINALGGGGALDTGSVPVIFYPGTVKRLVRTANPTTVIFGRIVDAAGGPLANATVSAEGESSQTDENGYIQLEIKAPQLAVRKAGALACTVDLAGLDRTLPFKDVGVMVCR
jgi:hypothetical protein